MGEIGGFPLWERTGETLTSITVAAAATLYIRNSSGELGLLAVGFVDARAFSTIADCAVLCGDLNFLETGCEEK